MYILRMYVLEGCPSCQQAAQYIQSRRLPCEIILANNDPIVKAGNETMNKEDKYPILLYNTTKEMVIGFNLERYTQICDAASVLFGNQSWNVTRSPEPTDGENPATSAQTVAGTV